MPYLRPQIVAAASRHSGEELAAAPKRGRRITPIVASFVPAVAVVCCVVASPVVADVGTEPTLLRPLQRSIVTQLNLERRKRGLMPLRASVGLGRAAREHALEMARRGYFGHNSAGGVTFARRIARFYPIGNHTYWAAGENLFWSSGEPNADAAVEAWLQSHEHRAILLDPRWRELGISAAFVRSGPGVYGAQDVTIVTADFGIRR